MSENVHVELLVGRRVRDAKGRAIGRIESIKARWKGNDCFVEEYHLGPAALLGVLGISAAGMIGWMIAREPKRIRWQDLDLSDPEKPRLRA